MARTISVIEADIGDYDMRHTEIVAAYRSANKAERRVERLHEQQSGMNEADIHILNNAIAARHRSSDYSGDPEAVFLASIEFARQQLAPFGVTDEYLIQLHCHGWQESVSFCVLNIPVQ